MLNAEPSAFGIRHSPVTTLDAYLLLMALIWGTNYAIVKSAFSELDPQAFNGLRLAFASALLTLASRAAARLHLDADFHTPARITPADWIRLAGLGVIGQCLYQYLFVAGLARTSVANAALIISLTPVAVTFVAAIGGRERVSARHWAGTLLSLAGIYVVVGRGAHVGGASVRGDLMLMASVVCWTFFTVAARPLMVRHSPLGVIARSMLIGTIVYVPAVAGHLARVPWRDVSALTWSKLIYSAVFALCVAYTIWYAAIRRIGSARTAIYSNLLPIVAMVTAYLWLHEPIGRVKLIGAAAVLGGVALTRHSSDRLGRSRAAPGVRQS